MLAPNEIPFNTKSGNIARMELISPSPKYTATNTGIKAQTKYNRGPQKI